MLRLLLVVGSEPVRTTLSTTVLALLERCVTSYEQLVILLALRERRGEPVSFSSLARLVHDDPDLVRQSLSPLAAAGVIVFGRNDAFYSPRTRRLAAMVDELARAREEQPLELLGELNRKAVDRIRADAARVFSGS